MTAALATINAIVFLLLAFWAVTLRQRENDLGRIKKELKLHTEALIKKQEGAKKVWCTYRFSESDYNKTESKMVRDAKERIAANIRRRVVKEVGLEEIIEGGAMVGYKIEIEIRKP